MENYGKRITDLRKKHNLTQSELGALLNVTPQAISKWENGLSEPDLGTLKKLCEIFHVTTDEMLSVDPVKDSSSTASQSEAATKTKIIYGYCESCQKPVSFGEYDVKDGGRSIICKGCVEKRDEDAKKSLVDSYTEKIKASKKALRRGLIRGGIWAIVIFLIFFTQYIPPATTLDSFCLVLGGILAYWVFTFRSQLSWDGTIADMISETDVFGLSLLDIILYPFFLVTGILGAPFYFPFALISKIREPKKLEKEKQKILNNEYSPQSIRYRLLFK